MLLLLLFFFQAVAWWRRAKVVLKCSSILSYNCLKVFFQVRPCYKNNENNCSFFFRCVHGSAKSNHYWGASLRTSSLEWVSNYYYYYYYFWVWDFSVALALYHISLVQAVRWIKSLGGKGDRASSEFWTLNWTDSGWCSRALTGRSAEFRPTAAAAAAGQFQCAPNLCFEFGMQKWKTRVFILHFLNFETLVAQTYGNQGFKEVHGHEER